MEERPIKVSVLCTAYQHAPYLRRTLESFVMQRTDFAFEVLVNDDASTDGSAEIVREYAELFPEIVRPFLQEKNLYSQGINIYDAVLYPAARGEYIALCEGDDCWTDREKLQRQVAFLDAHPDYTGCVHNTLVEKAGSGEKPRALFPRDGDRDIPFEQVLQGMSHAFHTSSILARRQYLTDPPDFRDVAFSYGFTDHAIGLWLTMNGKVRFLDSCMSLYRIGSNPSAWSSGVDRQYGKLIRFVTGQREMLRAVAGHVDGERRALVERAILEREFELLYLQGKTEELVRPPYDALFRAKPLSFRAATRLKNAFPALHRAYRRKKGYRD
ncbi:MAG: glycosyltransferase family 2 protein [Oscillospiraceae bacterium]|nr:glycosyltransferase family 2 protein [Oscillospiraceae bacterium]